MVPVSRPLVSTVAAAVLLSDGGGGEGGGGDNGEGGGGDGGDGGGGGGGEAIMTVGTDSTMKPNAIEAAAAVARLEESDVCTVLAAKEVGTAMVAVMITLAAVTLIATSELSMPLAAAMLCCKLEVFE